ncbi:uncharacterized protein LOC143014217 [Genypterus blacodes]|uniref:uncharacterized protein LOC143014217 n=1 Tax=Genypterus blacodes TaxID=154954 RepID=UPI003F75F4F7
MSCSFRSWCLFLLIAVVNIQAQKRPSIEIRSECLGNIMRVNAGPLRANHLEVVAVLDNATILLTPSLASQCGFSMRTDPLGNAVIVASLQNCFAKNVEDESFTTILNLRLFGNRMEEDELYQVVETCNYTRWATREIVCDHSFMEVSVERAAPDDYTLTQHHVPGTKFDPRRAAYSEKQPIDSGFRVTTVVFLTPEEKMMKVTEAQRKGYGIINTPTRLVVRSPPTTPETYTQNVAGVPMTVLRTSTIFEKKWLTTRIDATAACPVLTGSVFFTDDTISWFLPLRIDPLVSSNRFRLLEVHMGINNQRLDTAEMATKQYSMSVGDMHIIVEIPVGADGGYFKSQVKDDQYFMSYSIELMLELLWTEENGQEDTRYKVVFPITTPLMSLPPQVIDRTVAEERVFKVLLGPLGSDVALMNISLPSEVLSVANCNVRGFNVQEHTSHNGSKAFTLEVPFTDPAVLHMKEAGDMVYALHLTFGLVVLPEFTPFNHSAHLQAALVDVVHPSISGGCNSESFHVLVKYGTPGFNFETIVGKRHLTPGLAQQYSFMENGTHFSVTVPFSAPDAVFEAVESSTIRSRLDVTLRIPETNRNLNEFSMACNFPATLTECFPNGTMTALAMKLVSVPALKPSRLTLRDPTCRPSFSDERFAYFVFTANTCGTTRKFLRGVMLYENEISLPDELQAPKNPESEEPEYELKVSCSYNINTTQATAFLIRPRRSEPYAETAEGHFQVAMRLSLDDSYSRFYRAEDYPIVKPLQQPLYFEVELMRSTNPKVSLQLGNCWATLGDDRTSQLRWNLVIDGCTNPVDPYQVVFHAVWPDARVQYPAHYKRFEVQMFAFAAGQDELSEQLFIHCDVTLCDAINPLHPACGVKCSDQDNRIKGQRRSASSVEGFTKVSSGPILMA